MNSDVCLSIIMNNEGSRKKNNKASKVPVQNNEGSRKKNNKASKVPVQSNEGSRKKINKVGTCTARHISMKHQA